MGIHNVGLVIDEILNFKLFIALSNDFIVTYFKCLSFIFL